jgi:hypothetical protein
MKTGGAVGRPSGRSSLLDDPDAKLFDENGRELRNREKPRLLVPPRLYPVRIDGLRWRVRGGGPWSKCAS